jgi:HlyD family secretion protein
MIKNCRAPGSGLRRAVVLFALLAACRSSPATPPGFQGVVEYDDRLVSFDAAGRILSVPIHRGDVVKPGDVLATVEDRAERLQRAARAAEVVVAQADVALAAAPPRKEDVGALEAEVAAAQASEDLLTKSAVRARKLHGDGALTSADLDRAEGDLARASKERQALQQRLALARKGARPEEIARARTRARSAETAVALEDERLARYTLDSLIAGTVLDVHAKVGELAGVGRPAATIADTAHPYVDVFVPQGALAGVQVGSRASVRVDATNAALPGRVEWISPRTEFTPRYLFSERERPNLVVRVRVRIDDPAARLHAGVPAFAEVLP